MGFIVRCLFCFAVAFFLFSFAIISLGKRKLGALVCSEFRVASVLWNFLVVPWVGHRIWLWHLLVIVTYLLSFLLHHRPNIFKSSTFVFTMNRKTGPFEMFYFFA